MSERVIRKNVVDIRALVADLSTPLHAECLRDRARRPARGEADLSGGCRLVSRQRRPASLATAFHDFARFMRVAMAAPAKAGGYPIAWRIGRVPGLRAGESFRLVVGRTAGRIQATDAEGLRRALVFLEDEMLARRAPILPVKTLTRRCVITVRISRSPYATYRVGGGWELEHRGADYYPDAYLSRLAHAGINAVWVAGFFRSLIATKAIPELGPERTRLEPLARLVKKASRYGIKVYFFCMEPRLMLDKTIFRKYPDIQGATYPRSCSLGETQLCTSSPRVQAYLREATAELFRRAPGLAGIIDIFHGERGTNCWMTGDNIHDPVEGCPRCAARPMRDVLAELLGCFETGMRSVNPQGEILAWDYEPNAEKMKVLEQIGGRTVWLSCFEHGGHKTICGQPRLISEYSLSYVGPSPIYRRTQQLASRAGKRLYAKLQLGNTYEMSAVPYVPVPASVYRKFRAMQALGTSGAMISWIIGGFPSLMLKAAGEAAFTPLADERAFLRRLAAIEWGETRAGTVARAWGHFFRAFGLYPMNNPVFYYGPITRCPAYQLRLEPQNAIAKPYNWGITWVREIQPFEDDPRRWCGTFTERDLIRSFRAMAREWDRGLALLRQALGAAGRGPGGAALARQLVVAQAARIQFASFANVVEFYTLRNAARGLSDLGGAKARALYRRMKAAAEDDLRQAAAMKALLPQDPTLGFQSEIYYFSYSHPLLDAKIRQVRGMLRTLDRLAGLRAV